MKITHSLIATSCFVFTFIQCTPPSKSNEQVKSSDSEDYSLTGSWNLLEYIPYQPSSTEWKQYGDSIMYQKHLTDDQFVWIKFDTKNERLIGMGGGKYSIIDGKYIEDIRFFYPPGSSELGQAIPFDIVMKNGIWLHKGYAKQIDIDPESGEMLVIDSNKIEEKWVRTDLSPNSKTKLAGTWQLDSYLDENQNDFVEYPGFIDYIKLITPTHFVWVYFNNEGDEIYAAGSGTYEYDDNVYSEKIEMIHPINSGLIGEKIAFETNIKEGKWKHAGYIPNVSIDSTNGDIIKDSTYLDELWVRLN